MNKEALYKEALDAAEKSVGKYCNGNNVEFHRGYYHGYIAAAEKLTDEELKEGGGMKTKEEILFPLHGHCPEELDMVYRHDDVLKAMDEYAAQFAGTREEILRLREALYLISGAAASAGWAGFDPEKALIKIEQYANNALKPIQEG